MEKICFVAVGSESAFAPKDDEDGDDGGDDESTANNFFSPSLTVAHIFSFKSFLNGVFFFPPKFSPLVNSF